MTISIKNYRRVAIGTVALTGVAVASKRYLGFDAELIIPCAGLSVATVGTASNIIHNALVNINKNSYKSKDTGITIGEGIGSLFWGVAIPAGIGIASAFVSRTSPNALPVVNTFTETVKNGTFIDTVKIASDMLILSGISIMGVSFFSHLAELFRKE